MIPKIIHYCWFGDGPMGEKDKMCINSWKKYCPDYEIKEWNETNYDIRKNKYMSQAYDSQKWGFVPDYARLDIIYNFGGIYLDTDVELIKNLDSLLENSAFAGFEDGINVALGLGFGAEKGNEVIRKIRDSVYENRSFVINGSEMDLTPSPILNTEVLVEMGLKQDNTMQKIGSVMIYPKDYFCPIDFESNQLNLTKNTYSIHHYHASWLEPEEKRYREISIFVKGIFCHKLANIILWFIHKYYRLKIHVRKKGMMKALLFFMTRKVKIRRKEKE